MKTVVAEASLYAFIAIGTPFGELLSGDHPLSGRAIVATSVIALIAGANAIKAFMSTSYSRATADAILVRDQQSSTPKLENKNT